MAENDEFDQNQDQEGHIDTTFLPEQQEEFEADPKDERRYWGAPMGTFKQENYFFLDI